MAKPKLALIPAAQGTKLYSVLPSDGVGDFTFARGSVATRINAQGLIENVASGQSRLNYPMIDGVVKGCPHHILEPARTNLLINSNVFESNVTSVGYTQTDNNTISPEGALNGAKILETTSTTHLIQKTTSVSSTTDKYTASFFVKSNGRNKGKIAYGLDGAPYNSVSVNFDLESKSISNQNASGTGASAVDSSIKDYGNGWYRISITGVVGVTGTHYCRIQGLDDSGNTSYVGDVSKGFFVFGFQLEQGSFISSYIPTTTTTVTRSAETANGAGNATTFNDSEGVLMAEIKKINESTVTSSIVISDGTNTNRVQIALIGNTNAIYGYIQNGSGGTVITSNVPDFKSTNKVVVKYNTTQVTLWINGFQANTVIGNYTWANGTLNELSFETGVGTEKFYGNTKQVQYFDSALADTQLEQLTSWQSFRDMANGQLYTIE